MSSPEPNDLPVIETAGPMCRFLRNKGMYVFTDGCTNDAHDDYDNTVYWCLKTMKGFGPDDELVAAEECRSAARSCYEPT